MKYLTSLLLTIAPLSAFGADFDSGDSAWIMSATALVLFMTLPGLALFYGGLVRSSNVLSVLMQCFCITATASLVWVAFGYSLAFGEGGNLIGDFSRILLTGIDRESASGSIPESLFAMFQMTFAIITPALVVGGFAERIRFSAVLVFTVLWLAAVYIPITHWVWGGGWLAELGLLDFAGGTVVHITAGVAALVAALVIGPREGCGKLPMTPHNMPLSVAGAGMLWVGWFGFNGGSALAAGGDGSMAILVTHISACCGTLVWVACEWRKFGKPTALGAITGMVAGLGTITPASGYVGPGGAILIGMISGMACFYATLTVKNRFKIDDSLDVFPVHGVGGIIGTILAGVFCSTSLGAFSGYGFADGISTIIEQIGVQGIGVVATIAWTALATWVILKLIDHMIGLRVSQDEEAKGLDVSYHGERAYEI